MTKWPVPIAIGIQDAKETTRAEAAASARSSLVPTLPNNERKYENEKDKAHQASFQAIAQIEVLGELHR